MKLRLATKKELKKHLPQDPVRPHIKSDWRTKHGREVYVQITMKYKCARRYTQMRYPNRIKYEAS